MPIKKRIEKEDMDDKIRRKPKYAIHKYEMEESDFIIYLTLNLFTNHRWSNTIYIPQ